MSLFTTIATAALLVVPMQRDDLARAFLRFEAAYAAHPPPAKRQVEVERAFDALSMQFLGGGFGAALAALDDLTGSLLPGTRTPADMAFTALTIRMSDDGVSIASLYVPDLDEPVPFSGVVAALDDAGTELASREVTFEFDDIDGVEQAVEFGAALGPRVDALRFVDRDGHTLVVHPRGEEGRGVPRLIGDDEVEAIVLGDTHRVFKLGTTTVPARVFVPDGASAEHPLPLIVALHGAGGDEHMFFEGYGCGRLVTLARERGFIAVAPLTYPLLTSPELFPLLVDAIATFAPVDRSRVYVLGHSLGGIAAGELVQSVPQHLAAACCVAGALPPATRAPGRVPPVLVVAGDIDPIMDARDIGARVNKAIEAGLPLTWRLEKGRGHTLMVGDSLPDYVDWLLATRR